MLMIYLARHCCNFFHEWFHFNQTFLELVRLAPGIWNLYRRQSPCALATAFWLYATAEESNLGWDLQCRMRPVWRLWLRQPTIQNTTQKHARSFPQQLPQWWDYEENLLAAWCIIQAIVSVLKSSGPLVLRSRKGRFTWWFERTHCVLYKSDLLPDWRTDLL